MIIVQPLLVMIFGTCFAGSMKHLQKRRGGREACKALCTHNLGKAKWDKIIEEVETYVMEWEESQVHPESTCQQVP